MVDDNGLPKRLWGWKAIGAAVEKTDQWAMRWAALDRPRRIPVVWIAGTPSIRVDQFLDWMESWNGEEPRLTGLDD